MRKALGLLLVFALSVGAPGCGGAATADIADGQTGSDVGNTSDGQLGDVPGDDAGVLPGPGDGSAPDATGPGDGSSSADNSATHDAHSPGDASHVGDLGSATSDADDTVLPADSSAEIIKPADCPDLPLSDFREETIYFVITTRFYNGDPSNDYYNRDRIVLGDPTWRGDFKGLIARLDYLKDDLGFSAIWLTPVVTNRSGLDYHGYHGYDFTTVDPRLESPGATFQDLICEAHKRGMRIVLDVVFNHTSNYGIRGKVHNLRAPIKYYKQSGSFPSADPKYPYKLHLGDYTSPNREDDDNPLAPALFTTFDPEASLTVACPVCGDPISASGFAGWNNHNPNHFFAMQPDKLDPVWYHQKGYIQGGDWENPESLQQKHLAGDTVDLNTEHPTVKQYVIDAYKRYLDMGVDALRVDTVKHLERSNLLDYVNALKAHKPGIFVFGENLVKGPHFGNDCLDPSDNGPAQIRPWWYTRTTNDPCGSGDDDSGFSVLDFALFGTFRDNLSQGRFGGLAGVLARDWVYGDATTLVTFIDNHDIGPQNDWKFRFAGTDTALASALNFIFTNRGIPALFYGTEIRFKAGKEIDGPTAPHDDSGRAYFGDHLTPETIDTTRNHPFAKHIKRLNLIRRASPALQKGVMQAVGESDNHLQFIRDYDNGAHVVVVGLAQGDATIQVGNVKGGTYRDAVTGNELTVSDGGSLSFFVKGGSAGIYILNGPGKIGEDGQFLR